MLPYICFLFLLMYVQGDLNGDLVPDLAVGISHSDYAGHDMGAVLILFLNDNGTVSSSQLISQTSGGTFVLSIFVSTYTTRISYICIIIITFYSVLDRHYKLLLPLILIMIRIFICCVFSLFVCMVT